MTINQILEGIANTGYKTIIQKNHNATSVMYGSYQVSLTHPDLPRFIVKGDTLKSALNNALLQVDSVTEVE